MTSEEKINAAIEQIKKAFEITNRKADFSRDFKQFASKMYRQTQEEPQKTVSFMANRYSKY